MMDKTSPEKAVKELTKLLMYLTRFNELEEKDYIRQGSRRSKSIAITEEGMKLSRELLAKYTGQPLYVSGFGAIKLVKFGQIF